MSFFASILPAAINALSSAFGGGSSDPSPNDGPITAQTIGNKIGQAAGSFAGQYVNRAFDRAMQTKDVRSQFAAFSDAGLTPQEAIGGVGQVQAITLQQRQLAQKDRELDILEKQNVRSDATQRRGQDIQERTALSGQANQYRISAEDRAERARQFVLELERKGKLDAANIRLINEQYRTVQQDREFAAVVHSERFVRLFATMGPENVVASALAVINGVDLESVLRGLPVEPGSAEYIAINNFLVDVQSKKGTLSNEVRGAAGLLTDALRTVVGVGGAVVEVTPQRQTVGSRNRR